MARIVSRTDTVIVPAAASIMSMSPRAQNEALSAIRAAWSTALDLRRQQIKVVPGATHGVVIVSQPTDRGASVRPLEGPTS